MYTMLHQSRQLSQLEISIHTLTVTPSRGYGDYGPPVSFAGLVGTIYCVAAAHNGLNLWLLMGMGQ